MVRTGWFLLFVGLVVCACTSACFGQACGYWREGDGVPGISSGVSAAEWDPDGDGPRASVLVVANAGFADDVASTSGLVAWDGTKWIDPGIPAPPQPYLAFRHVVNYQGRLVLASYQRVDVWDRTRWTTIGQMTEFPYDNRGISGLVVLQGTLYAYGTFDTVNGRSISGVTAWNGTDWIDLGAGPRLKVWSLKVLDGDLYLAGARQEGPRVIAFLARREGTNWIEISGLPTQYAAITAIEKHDDELLVIWTLINVPLELGSVYSRRNGLWTKRQDIDEGSLRGFGRFNDQLLMYGFVRRDPQSSGPPIDSGVAVLNGEEWRALGSPVKSVQSVVQFRDQLIAFGSRGVIGGTAYVGAIRWDGTQWNVMGSGVGHPVTSIVEWDGRIVAAGDGQVSVRTAEGWRLITGGNLPYATNLVASAGGVLYAAYQTSVSSSRFNIARWATDQWEYLPPPYLTSFSVIAMAEFRGSLIAGGVINSDTPVPLRGVARWNEGGWSALGDGVRIANGTSGAVNVLTEFEGDLIVGGSFESPGRNIARWDGSNWHPMGDGLPDWVNGVAACGSDLFASTYGYGLFRWEGGSWVPVPAASLANHGGRLIAYRGGLYRVSGSTFDYVGVQKLSGDRWIDIGASSESVGANVLAVINDELVVGSTGVIRAGNRAIGYLGRWTLGGDAPRYINQIPSEVSVRRGSMLSALELGRYSSGPIRTRIIFNGAPRTGPATNYTPWVSPLLDGPDGAVTFYLLNVQPDSEGSYQIELTNGCGAIMTPAFTIRTRCAADMDGDGIASVSDLFLYIEAWTERSPEANQGLGYATITPSDFFNFLEEYFRGCP